MIEEEFSMHQFIKMLPNCTLQTFGKNYVEFHIKIFALKD